MRAWTPFGRAIMVIGVLMLLVMLVASQDTGDFPDEDTGDFPDEDTGDFPDEDNGDFPDEDTGDFPDEDTGDFPDDQSCPAIREISQNLSPIAGKQYSCAENNGHLYEAVDGHHFYMQCCTDLPVGAPIWGFTASDFGACMDACAQEPSGLCKSVAFDSAPAPGDTDTCIFFGTGNFLTIDHHKYHYAFLAEAPTAHYSDDDIKLCTTECPGSNDQVYTTPYGKTMRMVCGKRHGVQAVKEQVESWEQCMDLCGKLVPCQSVDYHRRTKRCYFGDHAGEPIIDAPGFSAAYNMGCAGACCNYPKPGTAGPSTPEAPEAPATPSKPPPPPTVVTLPPGNPCPQLHDTELIVNIQKWQIKCTYVDGYAHGGYNFPMDSASTMEECIQNCQNEARCEWPEYVPGTGYCGAQTKPYDGAPLLEDRKAQAHVNLRPL